MTDLHEMQAALRRFNDERDWAQYHSPRNLAMALSVETAELLELYLWSRDDGPQPALPERGERVAEEAADVLICLLNLCDRANIDLPAAFWRKLEQNATRYPVEEARGSMRKPSERS
ncbi:MAG TPA: nucleotide pyrophosphohydrolase [Polyangiaceae bacterium]|nr:nucleotide pyrophosphohydrolase [Polyangiaceae bacterium]